MNLNQIKDSLKCEEYSFLKTNRNLNTNIMLIGLGGSHAYGTNTEASDLDIRGIATNLPYDILCGKDFEQVVDVPTDTVIYSIEKMIKLLCQCNPNVIEILGLKPEHYLYVNDNGKLLLENKKLFLSKLAVYSFGGYATSQLRRMENKSARVGTQETLEFNIMKSIEKSLFDLRNRHFPLDEYGVKLYLDDSTQIEGEKEIFIDMHMTHYPLRDYANFHSEMLNVVKTYNKNNHRNTNAITHDKLGKHMMHLIRLYLMCIDILETEEIKTYRAEELPLLMKIRNGEFLDADRQPTAEFYELLSDFERRLEYASANTSLPEKVDINKINEVLFEINKNVIKGASL